MKSTTAYVLKTGQQFAKVGCKLVRLNWKWTNTIEDSRRRARKAWHTSEDFIDDVAFRIKKHPLKSLGMTFGVALGIGALAGWLGARKIE